MRILRIQRPSKLGIFQSHATITEYSNQLAVGFMRPYEHPEPDEDGIPRPYNGYRCGFRNWNQLKVWFPDEDLHYILDNHEFRLYIFEVPTNHIRLGGVQLMFNWDYATEIANLPLVEFKSSPYFF
jgi:hypothetical protein